ncbi:glucans biosynthesis glucosyltransferase MdoH [Acidomonas methanolica]|uniref:Glucans biosynthesis glucosyltransferase H n=2 Tax=Acidomonas methanolica TaxID=437 RepID=A0A023D2F7_ACIMT|nr:glucans biosynthesis glucosyltransferase MdoH [Acidomonas methanolica]MBU2655190.1 glucans biosynthesis glucosyltransferase MdoH [Acidomonas methanolica]TCS24717.1 membrane glycosyltransferase [Acidomonas methanolica]GAJ28244.1 glucosyltransferase MdoH [Acidomonas methanolica NBRC 104435]GBQ52456.1 glucosyltransferase MdoH [Acidomonas methanolica]
MSAMASSDLAFLPPEAPLAMPVQDLRHAPDRHDHAASLATRPPLLWLRRLFVFGVAAGLTIFGAYEMNLVLNSMGVSTLGVVVLGLFVTLGAWISLSFASCLAGFLSLLTRGGLGLGITRDGPLPVLSSRTAILMPTYNEDPERVLVGLKSIYDSLAATGQLDAFHFFMLSDTTDPDVWVQEERAMLAFRDAVRGQGRVFYRRRAKNIDRKAGNLGEWVRRFGGAYENMLTLDADSIMDGALIIRIVGAMERNPGVGLIQTLPVIVGGSTLFARMQQFAGRIYGPLIAYGIAWWHGSEGNYWGHNAVIRTRAFAEQAGLPHLPGRKPFGGHILSHDFVEAALMRRGGWAIHMVPGLFGSYEESPPSLTDVAIRDRRWCQGNLQHYKVLPTRGMAWVSRLHMLMGIGSYITSPLWLLFLLCGIAISLQSHFYRPEYFGTTKSLYPRWPQVDPVQAKYVFFGTMAILLAPKALAFIATLFDRMTLRGSGGVIRLAVSIVLETVIGGLIAPIAMLIHTSGVISILLGRDSGWNAQNRDAGGVDLREVARGYWVYTAIGLLMAAAAWIVSEALFLWMTPVLIGLALAIPLAAMTASRDVGLWLRSIGLLTIAEETDPPPILRIAERNDLACSQREYAADVSVDEAFHALRHDPVLLGAHKAALPQPRERGAAIDANLLVGLVKLREAPSLNAALDALSRQEKAAVLTSAEGVDLVASLPEG